MTKEEKNKDYIINLRVSRATYEKIKEKARENRESISNLVRKAIDDSSEIISDLSDEIFGRKSNKFEDVSVYYKAQVAKEVECANCKKKIAKGDIATVGETQGAKKYFFCDNCK